MDTRIRKLAAEGLDAIVLAAAGVRRLGLERLVTETIAPDIVLPAIGQGALGIEVRVPSAECREASVAELVKALDHSDTHTAVRAERAMLRRLGGGCQVPIAALASVEGETVHLCGLIASTDGATLVRGESRGARAQPETIGHALAEEMLDRGGQAILEHITGGNVRG